MYAALGSTNARQVRLRGGTPRLVSDPYYALRPRPLRSRIYDCLCPGFSRSGIAPVHGLFAAILQPRLVPSEEVSTHVLQSLLRHSLCNPLVPLPYLWYGQVGVEIVDHQQRGPPGILADGRDDVLYFLGLVWGQVAPHYKPPPVA